MPEQCRDPRCLDDSDHALHNPEMLEREVKRLRSQLASQAQQLQEQATKIARLTARAYD